MKIGISTSVIQRGKTGIAEYVFSLVRAFERIGKEHDFILFTLEEDRPLFGFAKNYVRLVRVPEKFRPPLRDIFWHQTILPRLAQSLQLDVLHVPSYRRMLWLKPCATVTTIHDLAPFHLAGKYDPARMFYGRVVARQLARRQDAIIAISRNTKRDLEAFWQLSGEKITVIPHGLDHERFHPAARETAKAAAANHFGLHKPFLLYVARLEHPAKNHLRLIAAFERFKMVAKSDWQLVLAGSDWHGAGTIHAAINRSPFAGDIRRLGFVPETELPLLYRAADIFVYPSLFEGFGFPPLEAMACGCPVVCSTRGALGEVAGDAAATLDPEDISDMQFQLARLAADEPLRARLRAAGLTHARTFDWNRAATATLEVYAKAARRMKVPVLSYKPAAQA